MNVLNSGETAIKHVEPSGTITENQQQRSKEQLTSSSSSMRLIKSPDEFCLNYKILKAAFILSSLRSASAKFCPPSWNDDDESANGKGVFVKLEDEALWNEFHSVTNEMIITKLGRCLFPNLKVSISGLNPNFLYAVGIDFVMVDYGKYKFKGGKKGWFNITSNYPAIELSSELMAEMKRLPIRELYEYPDSPRKGDYWNKCILSFNKIKLTNKFQSSFRSAQRVNYATLDEEFEASGPVSSSSSSSSSSSYSAASAGGSSTHSFSSTSSASASSFSITQNIDGLFSLHSFHRYIPRLHILPVSTVTKPSFFVGNRLELAKTFLFPQTSFIAVTHYQNNSVNLLKKNYNPHAKGFKDSNLVSSSSSQSSLPFHWSSPLKQRREDDYIGAVESNNPVPGRMYKYSHSDSEYFSSGENEDEYE